MATRLLIAGSVTRDFQQLAQRWSQPGGAPWHAVLGGVGGVPAADVDVTILARTGPWVRRYARPALIAAGARWEGEPANGDTVFVNRFRAVHRTQRLRSAAPPITCAALSAERFDAVVLSPLFPTDLAAGCIPGLAEHARFVIFDLQGLLRSIDRTGRVRIERTDLASPVAHAQALKFSLEEFGVVAGSAPWRTEAAAFAAAHDVELVVTEAARGATLFLPPRLGGGEVVAKGVGVAEAIDTNGAGDLLTATYAVTRARGRPPADALATASAAAIGMLQRRQRAQSVAARILPCLRVLELALQRWTLRRAPAGERAQAAALSGTPLQRAIEVQLGGRLVAGAPTPEDRTGALLSGAWALLTRGWPTDLAPSDPLAPPGLAGAIKYEQGLLRSLGRSSG